MMIRTQIYLPPKVHNKLRSIASSRKETMAAVIRGYLDSGLNNDNRIDNSGTSSMHSIANMNITGGPKDLSSNIDNYLYE